MFDLTVQSLDNQSPASFFLCAEPPADADPARRADRLWMMLSFTVDPAPSESILARLFQSLAEDYYRFHISLGTYLNAIAEEINERLYEYNTGRKRAAGPMRASAVLLAMRGQQMYLMPVGRAHALHLSGRVLTCCGEPSGRQTELGVNPALNLQYHTLQIQPGDRLVLSANLPPTSLSADPILEPQSLLDALKKFDSNAVPEARAALLEFLPGSGRLNFTPGAPVAEAEPALPARRPVFHQVLRLGALAALWAAVLWMGVRPALQSTALAAVLPARPDSSPVTMESTFKNAPTSAARKPAAPKESAAVEVIPTLPSQPLSMGVDQTSEEPAVLPAQPLSEGMTASENSTPDGITAPGGSTSPIAANFTPEQWQTYPAIPQLTGQAKKIYQDALAAGANPGAFSIIGDSQAMPDVFLGIFDRGGYDLDDQQDRFSPVIDQFKGSFGRQGIALQNGMNPASALTDIWNDPEQCKDGESSIECELRLWRPSIVLIDFSVNDTPQNQEFLRQVVQAVLDGGALPVLVTKADNREGDGSLNRQLVEVAAEFQLPVWNFWVTVQSLPNNGLDYYRDNLYLSAPAYEVRRRGALELLYSLMLQLNP